MYLVILNHLNEAAYLIIYPVVLCPAETWCYWTVQAALHYYLLQ